METEVKYETESNQGVAIWRPVMAVAEIANRQNAVAALMQQVMKRDLHYGVIPGTGKKPTLLKAGAEMLTTFFGLSKTFTIIERTEDWDRAEGHNGEHQFFYYLVRCHLRRGDMLIAEADGSCNSMESKYRYRNEWKAGVKTRVPNDDLASTVNTILKMASKRALVAAPLLAVGASDFFTQDIEDMAGDYVEGEFTVSETKTPAEPDKPKAAATPPPKADKPKADPPATNGQRPWDTDTLIAKLRAIAGKPVHGTYAAGAKGALVGWLDDLAGDTQRRITFLGQVFEYLADDGTLEPVTSSKQLVDGQWAALNMWRRVDKAGRYSPQSCEDIAIDLCRDELNRVVNAAVQAQAVGPLPGLYESPDDESDAVTEAGG